VESPEIIGQTFSHYRVVDRLGSGGMGVVYLAEDVRLGRVVALKFLSPECGRDPEALARFRHEARAASALDHPNICTIYDIGEWSDGRPFITMAYYEGQTVRQRLTRGPVPLPDALRIARRIADGLSRAHEHGIVHRDIKPANLIVTRDDVVKLVDLGVAKLADSPSVTQTGASVGTPAYMAPEQVSGGEVDKQSDLWSLGAVLYEMIAGRPPFRGESAVEVLGAILHEDPTSIASLRPGIRTRSHRLCDVSSRSGEATATRPQRRSAKICARRNDRCPPLPRHLQPPRHAAPARHARLGSSLQR
jgi:serine/threonine-protein kinase